MNEIDDVNWFQVACKLEAELDAALAENRAYDRHLEDAAVRNVDLRTALSQAPYQAYLAEQRSHTDTRASLFALQAKVARAVEYLTDSDAQNMVARIDRALEALK